MEYRVIDREHSSDILLKNDSFPLCGRMIPSYIDGKWAYSVQPFPEEDVTTMCFPDECYEFDRMSQNHVFIGAYDGETCVGLAVLADAWFRYMYLEDMKVSALFRGQGVGGGLIDFAMKIARERAYNGLYTIAQDNNLCACRFYIKMGFEIGGFDHRVYRGTSQEGKADIIFYLDG